MNFKIYVIGKIIEKFHKEAIKEYEKRLSRYCKIKLIQVKDKESLLKQLSDKTYIIQINSTGNQLTSEELASKIEKLGVSGKSDVSIIYSEEEFDFDEHLAISTMNMDLGLTTTILFEQIYRSYRIIHNQAYHK